MIEVGDTVKFPNGSAEYEVEKYITDSDTFHLKYWKNGNIYEDINPKRVRLVRKGEKKLEEPKEKEIEVKDYVRWLGNPLGLYRVKGTRRKHSREAMRMTYRIFDTRNRSSSFQVSRQDIKPLKEGEIKFGDRVQFKEKFRSGAHWKVIEETRATCDLRRADGIETLHVAKDYLEHVNLKVRMTHQEVSGVFEWDAPIDMKSSALMAGVDMHKAIDEAAENVRDQVGYTHTDMREILNTLQSKSRVNRGTITIEGDNMEDDLQTVIDKLNGLEGYAHDQPVAEDKKVKISLLSVLKESSTIKKLKLGTNAIITGISIDDDRIVLEYSEGKVETEELEE